jgi:hypothetical protein
MDKIIKHREDCMFFSNKKKDYFYLLEKHLESGAYNICACGENAPSINEIKKFEKEIGYKLPNDFKEFSISSLGGIYVEVKEEIWPRAKAYDVGPFWSFLYGVVVYGFSSEIPDWMNIKKIANDFRNETESDFTPFMKIIGDADVYCFGKNSKIYQWSHETNEFEEINKTFIELLDYELGALEDRKEKKKEQIKR